MSEFGTSQEGASSVRPPLLKGDNYSSWKGKMESYLSAIDDRVWMVIEDGYTPPTLTAGDGSIVPKPKAQWSAEEFGALKWNNKAIHALLSVMDESQYKLIQITKNAHESWKILEMAHEGTEVVKESKLQVLQTLFESIRMEEHECFNDFQVKLMDIVNQSHQLGDPYSDRRIKQKIMRSLPPRFESKVTALEENSDFKKMKPSEVIGRLLAYESRKAPTSSSPKKQKGIALKTSKVEKEDDDSDEEVAQMVKKFKKFLRVQKDDSKNVEPSQEKSSRKGIQCFECGGYGHISKVCGNLKNKRIREEMATSSSDSESVEDFSSDEELANYYTAFGASHVDVIEEGKNASICDLEEGVDEKVARSVIDEATQGELACMTSNDQDKDLDERKIDECCSYSCDDDSSDLEIFDNKERMSYEDFMTFFHDSLKKKKKEIFRLKEDNLQLREKVILLDEEVELVKKNEDKLKKELEEARMSLAKFTSGTEKLNIMLGCGKMPSDKRGLGFVDDKATPSSNKTSFVKEIVPKLPPQSSCHKKTLEVGESSKSAPLKIIKDKEMRYLEVLKKAKIKQPQAQGKSLASPLQHPRRKIDLGESSKNGQMEMPTKGKAQSHHSRAQHPNFATPRRHFQPTQPSQQARPQRCHQSA